MANLQIIIDAENNASTELNTLKTDIKEVGTSGEEASTGVDDFDGSLESLIGIAAGVAGMLATVIAAMEEVYETAKRGAAIQTTAGQFDNLTRSMGIYSETALTSMRSASEGMITDLDLMSAGTQALSLGVVDDVAGLSRLAKVSADLGMPMEKVVDMVNGVSPAGFERVGVSMDGFKEQVAGIMESNEGWTKSQAETEAGLQRLEGQVLKVGSATDMATAAYVKNEVAQQNSKDLAAQSTALMAGPAVEAWGAITQATVTNQRATLDSAQAMSELKAARAANVITAQQYTDAMKDLGVHSGKQIADTESLAATTAMLDAAYAKTGTTFDSMSGKVISVDTGGITNASGELDALNGKTLDGKEIPVKTGPVEDSSVQGYQPPDKYATVHYSSWYDTGKPEAVGGAVYGGNPYTWQEYGYKGELFVPSTNGFVLSRADAERALAKALTGGGASSDPQAIGEAVAKALSGITTKKQAGNVYNLTMPTSSNPADVRTAFELMEAWA